MKYLLQAVMILVSSAAVANEVTPESISKEYLKHEMNRMPIAQKMTKAIDPEEKAKYKAELQKVWDFSSQYVDKDRVQRNSSQAYHMGHFAGSVRTWATDNGMDYQNLLVRAKAEEKTEDYAVVALFVEHNQCKLEFYKIDGAWKITREQCIYKNK